MSSFDDESEISSDSSNNSYTSQSDSSNVSISDFLCGYVGEPEYNEEELKSIKFSSSENENSDAESEDELNSSRLENLHWCRCFHCTVMPTFIECKCCKEYQGLLGDKLEAGCITENTNFDTLCLNKIVLETAFIRHRHYKNNFTDVKEMTAKYVYNTFCFSSNIFSDHIFLAFFFFKTLRLETFAHNSQK